jgi:hypothetical protein
VIRNIDSWIGKTLFHPIIIAVCQKLNWTQYQFSRYISAIMMITIAMTCPVTIVRVAAGFVAILAIRRAIVGNPHLAMPSSFKWRSFLWFLAGFILWAYIIGARNWLLMFSLVVALDLIKEYALTIKTIPPREQEFTEKAEIR